MPSRKSALTIGICVVLFAAVWFVFGQTLGYPFVNYEDPGYVSANSQVIRGLHWSSLSWAFTHVHGGNWHPLTTLSHMLDCRLFGLNAGDHHLINVLLHGVSAILLFLILRQMTGSIWRSAFVAAVFAIHPLHVESVAWIAERKDVLSGVFFLLTLSTYVWCARKPSVVRYLTMSILFALGLISKPMLVTMPLLLLVLDYWPLQRRRKEEGGGGKLILEKIPLFLLAIGSSIATMLAHRPALSSMEVFPLSWRINNAIVSYIIYIAQMFWPARLAVFYPHPEDHLSILQVVVAAVLLFAMTVFAFISRKRFPYILTGWIWYFVMLAPVLGIVQVGLQGHADRYTYLPQIGLCILLAWLIVDLTKAWRYRRVALASTAAIIVVALTLTARAQTSYWRDSESLWKRALAVTWNNDVAHTNLSELLIRSGRYDEAIPHCQEAIRIYSNNPQAHYNLALAYLRTNRVNLATTYLKRTLELQPRHVNAALTLSWILATSPDPAVRDGAKAVQLAEFTVEEGGRTNPTLLHALAAAYAEVDRFDEALSTAFEALQLARGQNNSQLVAELQLNLENYMKHLPLRDPGLTSAPSAR